jgi:hypothetical protein
MRLSWRQSLLVDVGIVGAVHIFDENLAALDKDARVLPGNSALVSAVIGQVDVGKDVADRVFSPDDDLGSGGGEGQDGVGVLYDQVARNTGPRRARRRRGWCWR